MGWAKPDYGDPPPSAFAFAMGLFVIVATVIKWIFGDEAFCWTALTLGLALIGLGVLFYKMGLNDFIPPEN